MNNQPHFELNKYFNYFFGCIFIFASFLFCENVYAKNDTKGLNSYSRSNDKFGQTLQLSFIENKGQVSDQFRFQRHDIQYTLKAGNGLNIFIGSGAIHYQFNKVEDPTDGVQGILSFFHSAASVEKDNRFSVLQERNTVSAYRMDVELVGANKNAQVIAEEKQEYHENYFISGTDENGAIAYAYNRITYKNVYPNIDWVLYTSNGQLKHEFVVHEGGRVSDIKLKYGGATGLKLDNKGALIAETPQGTITEQAPYTYEKGGKQVTSSFKLANEVLSYETENYNGELVIDPTLAWATYYGGDDRELEHAHLVAADASGNVFLGGETLGSSTLATTGAFMETFTIYGSGFLAKFNSSGVRQWGTYYWGGTTDFTTIRGVTTDPSGNVGVVGWTTASTGIATTGAYQETKSGTADCFLAKFNTSGTRLWATYYGGPGDEDAPCIVTDDAGNWIMTGHTTSTSGITTTGAYQTTFGGGMDIFIVKFDNDGVRQWATYFGGPGTEAQWTGAPVAVDKNNNIYIASSTTSTSGIATTGTHQTALAGADDAYLVKFNSSGSRLWATYFGGSSYEDGVAVAVDTFGNAYVSGNTASTTGIATSGAHLETSTTSSFLAKFNSSGTRVWGTYAEPGTTSAVACDGSNVYIGGATGYDPAIASPGAPQETVNGTGDASIMKFNGSGVYVWGSYFGGNGDEEIRCMTTRDGHLYIAGTTNSTSGLATSGAHQTTYGGEYSDAFLAKFSNIDCAFPDGGTVTGATSLCVSGTTTLTSTVSGGTWTSSDVSVATVASTGVVTGIATGTAKISYNVTNACGCAPVTTIVTVDIPADPGSITGYAVVCEGTTATLYSSVGEGGVWVSAATGTATIGSASGILTGVTAGTAIISYSITNGCGTYAATTEATVNAAIDPGVITGTTTVCEGATTTLSCTGTDGGWFSDNVAIATIDISSGEAIGVSAGTVIISYSIIDGCGGAAATTVLTVNALPDPGTISGASEVDVLSDITLTPSVSGGIWSASNTNATVNSGGVVTGANVGVVTIFYTMSNSCGNASATHDVTVNVAAITGTPITCAGNTTSLSNVTSGGVWSCGNPAVATVDSTTGIVTGVSAGVADISYSISCGCGVAPATQAVTVNAVSAGTISGISTVCPSGTTTLTSTVSGGSWASSATGVATINTSTGVVTGVAAGTTVMTYTVTSGGCSDMATQVVTVNASPDAGTITGTPSVCPGLTTTLSSTISGGTWGSSATGVATVGSAGEVTGVSAGTAVISYSVTNTCGTAVATQSVTVNPSPDAGSITGTTIVCTGATTALSNATSGGAWSSGATGIATVGSTGIVTGVSGGVAAISYSVTNGCGTAVATANVTVSAPPATAGTITGASTVNVGATITLSNSVSGGVWSAGNTHANVSPAGVVTGASVGTVTISYTVSNSCGSTSATKSVTVNTPALDAITGTFNICAGTTTTLSNTATGGTWSSSSTAIATVGYSTGVVAGLAAGTATITYTLAGDYVTATVTINPAIPNIAGASFVCVGSTTTFTNTLSGGVWTSSNTGLATVNSSSGLITGVSGGTPTITYSSGVCFKTKSITVNTSTGGSISGSTNICVGSTSALSFPTSGTSWASSNTAVATIGATSGIVIGVSVGTSVISYLGSTGCGSSTVITIMPLPTAISGTLTVCKAATTTLGSIGTTGGTWASSATTKATVGSANGIVTGVNAGTARITYTWTNTCKQTAVVTVNPLPVAGAIVGAGIVHVGSSTTLSPSSVGGTWASASPAIATVTPASSSTCTLTGVSAGSVVISYTNTNGCGSATVTRIFSIVFPRPGGQVAGAGGSAAFSVYPNPTSGVLTIEAPTSGTFYVYTIDGRFVEQYEVKEMSTTITLPNTLASGIYMCRFNGDDGSTVMVRLVMER